MSLLLSLGRHAKHSSKLCSPKTVETDWIRETKVGFSLSSHFIFMETENKTKFNLLFDMLIVKREKVKNPFNVLSSDF